MLNTVELKFETQIPVYFSTVSADRIRSHFFVNVQSSSMPVGMVSFSLWFQGPTAYGKLLFMCSFGLLHVYFGYAFQQLQQIQSVSTRSTTPESRSDFADSPRHTNDTTNGPLMKFEHQNFINLELNLEFFVFSWIHLHGPSRSQVQRFGSEWQHKRDVFVSSKGRNRKATHETTFAAIRKQYFLKYTAGQSLRK
jgi:hypothetical protein